MNTDWGDPFDSDTKNRESLTENLSRKAVQPEGQTIVHCRYVSKHMYVNGGWVNIWESTCLVDAETEECLPMFQAFNVPVNPDRHYFKRGGEVKTFTLIFPAIPGHWKRFHLTEFIGTESGFVVSDIARNETGVYHVQLT